MNFPYISSCFSRSNSDRGSSIPRDIIAEESREQFKNLHLSFVEMEISQRYCKGNEVLGRGSCKTVYRAFDRSEGIEVAWNEVDLRQLGFNPTQSSAEWNKNIQQLKSEVELLRNLHHKNIIQCYNAWFDERHNTMNFITELCTSGTLREYRERFGHVDQNVIRSWASQILEGLVYLHGRKPPIAHRDLKCDNVFINGNTGEIKIGDLGLACVMQAGATNLKRPVVGTSEYMAPEIFEGYYSELVDVFSFGMCVLEMVTVEYPYQECKTLEETFHRIREGKKPKALKRVTDPEARDLIEKCLEPLGKRPSASVLLDHLFFQNPECCARDVITDQCALKNPSEGTEDHVGVECRSPSTKTQKYPPPERRRRPVGDEASYRGYYPSMADKFGMPGQAGPPEGFEFDKGKIKRKPKHGDKNMMEQWENRDGTRRVIINTYYYSSAGHS